MLRDRKAGEISDDEAIKRLERSPYWVWTAMDPKSKLLVVVDVGSRTLAMAQRVVHQVTQVLAPGCVPLFLTDGLKDYGTALLTHFGHWMQPERRQDKGPMPKPRWMPLPELLYAQVVKSYRRRRIVGVTAPRGVRHPAGHRADPGGMWLDHQYGVCRAAQPRHPPARGGDRAPGQHPVPGRSGLAGMESVGEHYMDITTALGSFGRFAAFDDLVTLTVRAADCDERHGPFLPHRGYEDEAQCDSNLSPSPLLKHYPLLYPL